MSDVPARLASLVRTRAGDHCEYCRLSQVSQEAAFHIDHVVPRSANGPASLENLALACVSCSLRKGARRSSIDSETNLETPLFNPREQNWSDHFRWDGFRIEALTAVGRVTIFALAMNRPVVLMIREEQADRHRHLPN